MFTWGEIRVGYYGVIVLLVWFVNGTASAIFLGILIALLFERDFRRYVLSRYGVAPDDRASVEAISAAKAEAQARSKANSTPTSASKPKKAAADKKPRATKPKKPKAADEEE